MLCCDVYCVSSFGQKHLALDIDDFSHGPPKHFLIYIFNFWLMDFFYDDELKKS